MIFLAVIAIAVVLIWVGSTSNEEPSDNFATGLGLVLIASAVALVGALIF